MRHEGAGEKGCRDKTKPSLQRVAESQYLMYDARAASRRLRDILLVYGVSNPAPKRDVSENAVMEIVDLAFRRLRLK